VACKRGFIKVKLKIEARDRKGKVIAVREKDSDLILDNFRDIIAAMLTPYFSWGAVTGVDITAKEVYASLVDTGGTARNTPIIGVRTIGTGDRISITFLGLAGYDDIVADSWGVRIRIGTSTVAPTRGDYKLGAQVALGTPTRTVGADYISWAVSIVLEAAADIAEAGMCLRCNVASVGSLHGSTEILLFRDTFTPISVPAGGTISVTYTLTL